MEVITDDDAVTYIPEADDNRLSDDPWHVELVPMTAAELRKYMMVVAGAKEGINKVKQANGVLAKIFRDRVIKVSGLTDIRGRPIETGDQLFDRSETEYIDEVWSALTKASQLRSGLKKD